MSSDYASSSGSQEPLRDQAHSNSSSHDQGASPLLVRKRKGENEPKRQSADHFNPHRTSSGDPTSSGNNGGRRNEDTQIPKKNRSSSGFLLDHAGLHSRLSFFSRPKHDLGKGKERSSGVRPVSTTSIRSNSRSRFSSIRKSPLATEVSTVENAQNDSGSILAVDGHDSRRSDASPSDPTNNTTLGGELEAQGSKAGPRYGGYDTDPTQIVNMALSLNEGRRRQASAMRLASGDAETRPSVSIGRRTSGLSARRQSGLSNRIDPEGQLSRHASAEVRSRGNIAPNRTSGQSRSTSRKYLESSTIEESKTNYTEQLNGISDATFARVQKAKEHFELLYEHRRLLPHLPPLRAPGRMHQTTYNEGRSYNPLQCSRNRKVRYSERRTAKSDGEGWHDVEQVRSWIDAVVESHTEPRNDPDQCIRLPAPYHLNTFVDKDEDDPITTSSLSSSPHKRAGHQNTKHHRQRSDWLLTPTDLLADVYWLEQGSNKTKVEDRDGNKIYSRDTPLKFTAWRTGISTRTQEQQRPPTPPRPMKSGEADSTQAASPIELPTFTSAGHKGRHGGRGRQRGTRTKKVIELRKSESPSRTRRKRLARNLIRPLSRSSTSASDNSGSGSESQSESESDRGGKLSQGKGREKNKGPANTSSSLEYHVRKILDHDTEPVSRPPTVDKSQNRATQNLVSSTDDVAEFASVPADREEASPKKRRTSDHLAGSHRESLHKRRQSHASLENGKTPRSSLDYDSTAESTPSIPRYPGLATNLSSPASRSPSPKKKILSSMQGKHHSKQRKGIDRASAVEIPSSLPSHRRGSEAARQADVFASRFRDISPMTKAARSLSDRPTLSEGHRPLSGTTPKPPVKPPNNSDAMTRVRGIFRGGKLGELVGNEVSRFGDIIWRRDPPVPRKVMSRSSLGSTDGSTDGSDDGENLVDGRPGDLPQPRVGRVPSISENSSTSPTSSRLRPAFQDKPSYFMNNLPSFISPLQRDREFREDYEQTVAPPWQSLSPPTLRANHRSTSNSPRHGGTIPLKLRTSRSSSPKAIPERGRRNRGVTPALVDPVNASRALSSVLSQTGSPADGVTNIKYPKSSRDLKQRWSDSSSYEGIGEYALRNVTRKDIARAHAALISSSAKARQISLRANIVRDRPPPFLLNSISPPPSKPPTSLHVPRKFEHQLAVTNLVSTLTAHTTTFHASLAHFTETACPNLHSSLQALDDRVVNHLTPRVRTLADFSGDLSMKLTTTSTLAVQGLNETIEAALRRKRRGRVSPLRWLRRLGFGIVEWMVVGLLRLIWFVVMLVRVVRCSALGLWWALKWLFWIE